MFRRELGIKLASEKNSPYINSIHGEFNYHIFSNDLLHNYYDSIKKLYDDLYTDNNVYIHIKYDDLSNSFLDFINEINNAIFVIRYDSNLNANYNKFYILPKLLKLQLIISPTDFNKTIIDLKKLLYQGYFSINGYYPFIETEVDNIIDIEYNIESLFKNVTINEITSNNIWNYIFYPIVDRINIINKLHFLDSYINSYILNDSMVFHYYNNSILFNNINYNKFLLQNHIINNLCNECKIQNLCYKANGICDNKDFYFNFAKRMVGLNEIL